MATEREIEENVGGAERPPIEETIKIPLSGGRFIDIRITIASAPKVGPGPRPNMTEILLVKRVDEDQVLTISAELTEIPASAISVGSGGPPTGGN